LFQAKKQIVVTSDRPPKDISHLEKRLKSRFGAGIIVDIQAPEFETRVAILQKEIDNHPEVELGTNIVNLIAERIEWNVRELKGALNQVMAIKSIQNEDVTEDRVRQVLENLFEKV
jgi:chromosomal replication initiator protein